MSFAGKISKSVDKSEIDIKILEKASESFVISVLPKLMFSELYCLASCDCQTEIPSKA